MARKKKRIRDIDINWSDIEEESCLQNAIDGAFGSAVLYGRFSNKELARAYLHLHFRYWGPL